MNRLLVIAVLLLGAFGAHAQGVFAPGPLSSAHKQLDGITNCTKCHEEAGKHSNDKCLACHTEIKTSSFHKSNLVKGETFCADCHKEHKGGDGVSLIDWKGSKRAFNHSATSWPLEGSHKKPECKTCHTTVTKEKRETFIGLSTSCNKCHFDEHRGQEGNDCSKCHNSDVFKKAPFFVHKNPFTEFILKGRHKSVGCGKCHDDATDDNTPANAVPAPRARTFMQMEMKGVTQTSCTACHDDVHHGQFGRNCVKCHSEDGWKVIKQAAEDTGFHDKTGFPLRGEHTSVACKSCHGSGGGAVFKGLKHARCADCHADAHAAQVPLEDGVVKCEKCHTVNGFLPVVFDGKAHEATRFPLQGSHAAVACNLCHKRDTHMVKKAIFKRDRKTLVSDTKLALPDVSGKCETCHADPHNGQLKDKACDACHVATSFTDLAPFKHENTRFPLTGKHAGVSCGGCHVPLPGAKGKLRDVVIYKPLDIACASCHADQHVGQLAKNGITSCDTCHQTKGFKPAKFDHTKQSTFPLDGKHKDVRCAACHPLVDVGGVVASGKSARYKPLPAACAGCHEDEHKGAFDKLIPAAVMPPKEERCGACHVAQGWAPAKLAHERTVFPLVGKHTSVVCGDCHGSDTTRPIPTSCAGCHMDPHQLEFGLMCRSCHTEQSFSAPNFLVDSHRRTNFPLSGRHAAIPCEECHIEKRERTFTRAALDCVACHAKDALSASLITVDHTAPAFTASSCRGCHEPVSFTPARYLAHEACFPIARGVHVAVTCAECHSGLRGAVATGACAKVPVRCAECHAHSEDVEAKNHVNIAGYEHKSEKCAGCHRSG